MVPITSSFELANTEPVPTVGPITVGHSADAELLGRSPEVFGAAWLHTDGYVRVSRWSTNTKTFGTQHTLPYGVGTRKWVRRMGYLDDCDAISGATQCGFFTWEDTYGYVNWQGFAPYGGTTSVKWVFGHDGSGDCGNIGSTHRCILAYISSDRTQVRGLLLDSSNNPIRSVTIHSLPTSSIWKFWQTAVAYDTSGRFMVTWTLNTYGHTGYNGAVQTHYVTFDGALGPQRNHVMYCSDHNCGARASSAGQTGGDAGPAGPTFGVSAAFGVSTPPLAPVGSWVGPKDAQAEQSGPEGGAGGGPRMNDYCVCKSIFFGRSRNGSSTDRFRLHEYGTRARLNSWGGPASVVQGGVPVPAGSVQCTTRCPIGQGDFQTAEGFAPFLVLSKGDRPDTQWDTYLLRGVVDTDHHIADVLTHINYLRPVALRTPDYGTTIGLGLSATDSGGLALTVAESVPYGCP